MHKKTFTNKTRKAFSLIELSIVLIIIGLLVAGVTGGASLIKNAELRGIAAEARGYQTAVNSFFAKYSGLPGDLPNAIGTQSGAAVGNNDGLISFIAPIAGPASKMEGNTAWQMLKNDNFVSDSFTPATADAPSTTTWTTALTGGSNVPASKSKNGAWAFDNITPTGAGMSAQNVVVIFGGSTTAGVGTLTASTAYSMVSTPTAALTAASSASALGNAQLLATDAFSIDSKVDDGAPNTGKVTALLGAAGNCTTATTAAGLYTTATAYRACALAFQVDPNS